VFAINKFFVEPCADPYTYPLRVSRDARRLLRFGSSLEVESWTVHALKLHLVLAALAVQGSACASWVSLPLIHFGIRLLAVSGHYFRAPTDLRAAFETGTPFSPTPVNSKAIPWIVDLIKALRSTYGPGHPDDVLVEMISIQFKGQGLHPDLRPHDRSLSARGAK
jgi:hypothetical protein